MRRRKATTYPLFPNPATDPEAFDLTSFPLAPEIISLIKKHTRAAAAVLCALRCARLAKGEQFATREKSVECFEIGDDDRADHDRREGA